jgi:RNA polymerase sigma-70 factor (ECF subfamily)
MRQPENLTTLLTAFAHGERDAAEQVIPLVYDELRRIAHRRRWQWVTPETPDTTSLVHEAYLHLQKREVTAWETRAHFFYFASVAMRNILVDHAKHVQRQKRGGGGRQVELTERTVVSEQRSTELLGLDEALRELEREEPRLAQVVECRFFGGLTVEETAEALSVSPATVKRGWDTARAWLFQRLRERPRAHEAGAAG